MSALSELFTGVKKKPFQPMAVDDPYTDQYLQGIDASGLGAQKRINDTFDMSANTGQARLFSRGWGNSSLAGSYSLGNEDRRQQALLDLDNQLFAQRLQARQAGTSSALQQFGINNQANNAYQQLQQQKSQANSELFGNMIKAGASIAAAPVTGGTSLLGLGMGLGGGNKASKDPYAGLYGSGSNNSFMGY